MRNTSPGAEYKKLMQEIALRIPDEQSEPSLPTADDIRIRDEGPVTRRGELYGRTRLFPIWFSARQTQGPTRHQLPV